VLAHASPKLFSGDTHDMKYTALNPALSQIRLLHLQPAPNKADVVEGHLNGASLDDPSIEYEVLSYDWGERDNDQNILLGSAQ
jgi:hypothetical protein